MSGDTRKDKIMMEKVEVEPIKDKTIENYLRLLERAMKIRECISANV